MVKGVTLKQPDSGQSTCARSNGVARGGVADGRPLLKTAEQACEAILTLSGMSKRCAVAVAGFEQLEKRTGRKSWPTSPASTRASRSPSQTHRAAAVGHHVVGVVRAASRVVGNNSPFTIRTSNVGSLGMLNRAPALLPLRTYVTLDGRGAGECLLTYRPPLNLAALAGYPKIGDHGESHVVVVRYLTPHSKWSIHLEYQDNLFMLGALSRRPGDSG